MSHDHDYDSHVINYYSGDYHSLCFTHAVKEVNKGAKVESEVITDLMGECLICYPLKGGK